MTSPYQRKIRHYFLKKNFQGKITLTVFLTVIFTCIVFTLLLALFSSDSVTIAYSDNELHMGQTPFMLLRNAIAANWLLILFVGSFLVLLAIIVTHRIAGPLYRFEQTLEDMNNRNLTALITLREHDEGKEIAESLNTFNRQLSRDLSALQTNIKILSEQISQLDGLEPEAGNAAKRDLVSHQHAMRRALDHINSITASYKILDEE